jgi:WhiB family redox-sensing transcriptional regulator
MSEALNDSPNPRGWMDEAPCRGATDLFYPSEHLSNAMREDVENRAKQICSECEFASLCLQLAIERREKFGVWGGATEKERRTTIRREQRIARRQRAQQEGSV